MRYSTASFGLWRNREFGYGIDVITVCETYVNRRIIFRLKKVTRTGSAWNQKSRL